MDIKTKEDLDNQLKEIDSFSNKRRSEAYVSYAMNNNPYEIDDVIKDHLCTIKVASIKIVVLYGVPSCVYHGVKLKNDGTPYKRNIIERIHQINILEKEE